MFPFHSNSVTQINFHSQKSESNTTRSENTLVALLCMSKLGRINRRCNADKHTPSVYTMGMEEESMGVCEGVRVRVWGGGASRSGLLIK